MYLESLKINGFKSFARKTKFLFNDGITAIVGPNGCGKSNTVDAIRWVLGEQKAGMIRSEKMENVIFNGTNKVKPVGMAEVSLTIQNTKNILPIEYSEVVITRRLFRSLESQYLLNNTPCRLKDIQNLFLDTGMGPNAYSIIELSMVESILSGRPEERRRILEEAAGVTKYKIRRRQAFRKLEATEADLVRVNDIISEVEKSVASLHRQVRKAQRYQELRQQLQESEINLATYQFSHIRLELEPLTQSVRETQDSRVTLTARFDEKEAELEEARRQLLESERKLSEQQKELNAVSVRIQKKEEDILVGRERRKALEDAKVKLERDRDEIVARLQKTRTEIAAAKETLQGLFEKIRVAETDFQEKDATLNKMERRVHEKNEQMKTIENQRLQAVEGMTDSKKDEERIKTQLENINERITAINRELEESKLLARIRQEKVDRFAEQKTTVESELRRLNDELTSVQNRVQKLSNAKDEARERIMQRRGEVQTLKERIELLKKFIESYEDHPEGVQHLLLQGHLNGGCKGTLAENLTVDTTYRRAVETAMGDASVSLIVEATDQALECIEILKSDDKGAVTFFPLDKFARGASDRNGSQNSEILKLEGVIGWAYNLVNCDNQFRPLVKSLLNEYLIVDDLKTARGYADSWRDKHLNLITLNGEIVSTWGPIKGGSSESSQAAIIGRKALVEELEINLSKTFARLDENEAERTRIEQQVQEASQREQELTGLVKAANSRLTEVEVQLANLEFEARKDAELRDRLQKEHREQMTNEKELTSKFEDLSPSLKLLVDNKGQFEVELEKVSEQLLQMEEEIKAQRDITQDSRVNLVDLKGEERHLQENISRLNEFRREMQESLARLDREIESSILEYGEIEKRIGENKSAIEVDFDEHQTLEAQVHELEQKFMKDRNELQSKEKVIKEIRDERDRVSETLHSMELRVSELRMNAEKIKDRIEEEYEVEILPTPIAEELDTQALGHSITRHKERLNAMGPVNLLALKEYEKEKARLDFLVSQRDDLVEAEKNLSQTIRVINQTARAQFEKVFDEIKCNFSRVFAGFFEHGQARLQLEDETDPLEADIVIEADPKGRRVSALTLLSGGEKALTAISLLFAIYLVKPSPFCILDEVDAPLDDANIGRFVRAIREFSQNTQFLVVTHNKLTMRAADCLYGVTMEEDGVSKVVSVNFRDMEGLAAA
ncbi:MAG: chromosome segregation protein SMC [bacterium]